MNLDASPDWLQPATGLSATDLQRIGEAVTAARAGSTRTVYANLWRLWERWCHARDLDAFPADPMVLCAYLAERAESGTAVKSLGVACSAIGHAHRVRGAPDPITHHAVREVLRGLRRTCGVAPFRQARPLTPADVRRILASIERTTPIGARDAAIILLGYASALRSCELVALTLDDIEPQPGGLLLKVRSSKTDQEAEGAVVGVAHGNHAQTDPVQALAARFVATSPDRCSPGCSTTTPASAACPPTPSPACFAAGPPTPASPPNASLGTPCEPATPPPRSGRRPPRSDRHADPAQGPLGPPPLHPTPRSARLDHQPRPRPVISQVMREDDRLVRARSTQVSLLSRAPLSARIVYAELEGLELGHHAASQRLPQSTGVFKAGLPAWIQVPRYVLAYGE